MRGSCRIFRYFWRLVACVNLRYSPSHTNHMGDDWGDPSGRMVATWANCLEFRIFWTFGLLTSAMASLLAPFCSLLALPGTAFSSLHSLCIAMSSLAQTRPGGPISVVSQSAMETKLIILHSGALKKLQCTESAMKRMLSLEVPA